MRIGRGQASGSRKPSSHERWLATTTTGPVSGTLASLTTRNRQPALTIDDTTMRTVARGAHTTAAAAASSEQMPNSPNRPRADTRGSAASPAPVGVRSPP